VSVCALDVWFKQQPYLTRVRLIKLWGQMRLHTCGALANHRIEGGNHPHTLRRSADVLAC